MTNTCICFQSSRSLRHKHRQKCWFGKLNICFKSKYIQFQLPLSPPTITKKIIVKKKYVSPMPPSNEIHCKTKYRQMYIVLNTVLTQSRYTVIVMCWPNIQVPNTPSIVLKIKGQKSRSNKVWQFRCKLQFWNNKLTWMQTQSAALYTLTIQITLKLCCTLELDLFGAQKKDETEPHKTQFFVVVSTQPSQSTCI